MRRFYLLHLAQKARMRHEEEEVDAVVVEETDAVEDVEVLLRAWTLIKLYPFILVFLVFLSYMFVFSLWYLC